ncbi:FCD domain-containing protein [Streptomyces sp. NPDC057620]|uniref:GntR family transcriptional regulator n=1 Tax=Streptomyces sp. NPDC057620 TaxID=3346185 RepID=UPI0036C97534
MPGAESRRTATGAPGRAPESCEAATAPSGASEGPDAPGGSGRAPASLGAPEAPGVPGAPVAPGAVEAPEDLDGPGAAGGRGTPSRRRVPDARTASVGPVSGPVFAVAAPRPVIQRLSVRGQVLDALRAALVAGDLAPGEVYSAPALGERFGVSATPVREAMQQLANEGAVEVVPNRGFRVIRRGARELAELAEIRALVEMPVMLRLTRTVAAPCWAELRPLADTTVAVAATGDLAGYAESDRVFHAAVLALSGNRQLVQLADDLHRRAQWPMAGVAARRGRGDLLADAVQHTALLDALSAGDVAGAQALIRGHFPGA